MNGAISKLFVRALAHKTYQNVTSWQLEPNLMAQITLDDFGFASMQNFAPKKNIDRNI